MTAILIFKCTEGAGVGNYSSRGRWARKIFLASSQTVPSPLSSFDTHARWQPETQSTRSRRSLDDILIFKCTEGTGVGDYSSRGSWARKIFLASSQIVPSPLSSFDTHARWQPETQSARSRRSYRKIEDCEQSMCTERDTSKILIILSLIQDAQNQLKI